MPIESALPPLASPPPHRPLIAARATADAATAALSRWPRRIASLTVLGGAALLGGGVFGLMTATTASAAIGNLPATILPEPLRSFSAWSGTSALLGALLGAIGIATGMGLAARAAWSGRLGMRWTLLALAWLAMDISLTLVLQRDVARMWRQSARLAQGVAVAADEAPPFERQRLVSRAAPGQSLAKLMLVVGVLGVLPAIVLIGLRREDVREEWQRWQSAAE